MSGVAAARAFDVPSVLLAVGDAALGGATLGIAVHSHGELGWVAILVTLCLAYAAQRNLRRFLRIMRARRARADRGSVEML